VIRSDGAGTGGPIVSVITPVLNGIADIGGAMCSVLEQSYGPVEYLVMDGGSTDGTVDVIRRHDDRLALWSSAQDGNMYIAINRALNMVTGDIVGIVNADDRLVDGALERVAEAFRRDPAAGFVYGPVTLVDARGKVMGRTDPVDASRLLAALTREMPLPHPGCFVATRVYRELGGYDTRYRLSADYEFVARMLRAGYRGTHVEEPLSCFRIGGASGGLRGYRETLQIQRELGVPWPTRYRNFAMSVAKAGLVRRLPAGVRRLVTPRSSRHHVA
jgi:glycosyltransferase involved in cell wall biosynthesis